MRCCAIVDSNLVRVSGSAERLYRAGLTADDELSNEKSLMAHTWYCRSNCCISSTDSDSIGRPSNGTGEGVLGMIKRACSASG